MEKEISEKYEKKFKENPFAKKYKESNKRKEAMEKARKSRSIPH